MELICFLLSTAALFVMGVLLFKHFPKGVYGLLGCLLIVTSLSAFALSTIIVKSSKSLFETKDAKEFQTEFNIIAVADGYPNQTTNDMRFINKDLVIEKETKRTIWGWEAAEEYHIKIK